MILNNLFELITILNLIKVHKIPKSPIVLIGKVYWEFFDQWFQTALDLRLIIAEHCDLFTITDDYREVVSIMRKQQELLAAREKK